MIGKAHSNKSYKATIQYLFKESKGAEIIFASGVSSETDDMIWQFEEIGKLHNRSKNKLIHAHFSLSLGESLNDDDWIEISKNYAKELEAKGNQIIAVKHKDKEYEHIHVLINRVSYDGKLLKDSFCSNKAAKLSDEMEQKFGLVVAKTRGNLLKEELKKVIDKSIEDMPSSLHDLWNKIRQSSWDIKHFKNGVSFFKKKNPTISLPGYKLGKNYTLKAIKARVKMQLSKLFNNTESHESLRPVMNRDALKSEIKEIISSALDTNPKNLEDLWSVINKSDWKVVLNNNRGVSFSIQNGNDLVLFKGSEISRSYSLSKLEKTLNPQSTFLDI